MLKEILKAEAHMSSWWKKTERYTKAANAFNADPTTRWNTDHQHGKDRFYLLKGGFEALDRRRCDRTAQEEVLNSMENLLVTRVEEHNGYQQKIAAERNEKNATEEDLMLKGKTMRDVAMSCRGASAMPDVTEGGAPPGGGAGGTRRRAAHRRPQLVRVPEASSTMVVSLSLSPRWSVLRLERRSFLHGSWRCESDSLPTSRPCSRGLVQGALRTALSVCDARHARRSTPIRHVLSVRL